MISNKDNTVAPGEGDFSKTLAPSLALEAPHGSETSILDPTADDVGRMPRIAPSGEDRGVPGGPNDVDNLYQGFIDSSKELEDGLQDFSQKVLKLGSGHALSRSSIDVKKGLTSMHLCFETKENIPVKRKKHKRPRGPGGVLAQTRETNLSVSLKNLSGSLNRFSIALTDFDDYYEQKTYLAISEFRTEILILAEALSYFSNEAATATASGSNGHRRDEPELTEFINSRLSNASEQFKKAKDALSRFVDTGIPCIEIAQERSSRMMLNASTVATFFAGVAATTLQYTGINIETTIGRAIQTLWFSSLVLSIGSAITSLLVFAWRQAVFSRTQRKLPLYIRFWSRSGYLVLLSASIIAFISGLVAYVYELQRTKAMFWVVIASTAFCAISLADVLRCFATDQWNFWKSRKARALARIFSPEKQSRAIWKKLKNIWPLLSSLRHFHWYTIKEWRMTRNARLRLWRSVRNLLCSCYTNTEGTNDIDTELAAGMQPETTEPTKPDSINNVDCSIESIRSIRLSFQGSPHIFDDKIYDMQFSPDGKWLAVCTTFRCYAKQVNSEAREDNQVLGFLVRQVKWSPDGERLLTRNKYHIVIWSLKNGSTFKFDNYIEPGKSLVDVEWINDSSFVALSNDADSMFTVHLNNEHQETVEIRLLPSGLTIYEMTTMIDPGFILLLATRVVKDVPEEKGISCIIVYDMENNTPQKSGSWWRSRPVRQLDEIGKIKSKVPLLMKAKGITAGPNRTRLVVTYEESLPEIWSIDSNGTISRRCKLPVPNSKANGVWGSASFVGHGETLIACAEDGIVHFWEDKKGDFGFDYSFSLNIHHEADEDEGDDDSDDDSDNGSDDDEEKEAVLAWTLNAGSPTMASGYLGLLKEWSPGKSQEEKNSGLLEGNDKVTTVQTSVEDAASG